MKTDNLERFFAELNTYFNILMTSARDMPSIKVIASNATEAFDVVLKLAIQLF